MEINSSVSDRLGVIGGEAWGSLRVFVDNSGLPSCPLLMRMRNRALGTWGDRRETRALGAPGLGCRKQEGRGTLSEEPPNPDMGNGVTLSHVLCDVFSAKWP